jgi:hypothetical protein
VNAAKDKIDIRSLSLEALQEHFVRLLGKKKVSGPNKFMNGYGKNHAFLSTR